MGTRTSENSLPQEPDESSHVEGLPPLLAELFVLGDREYRSRISAVTPDKISNEEFASAEAYVDALSGRVALAVVSVERPDEQLEWIVRQTLRASEHARIVLTASDGAALLRCEVPHDESFVLPEERDALEAAIKELYVRAYYSVTLDRYYKIGLAIKTHGEATDPGDRIDEETLGQWREKRMRLRSYLEQFRAFLGPDSFKAIASRGDRFDALVGSADREGNPSAIGLPDSCPDCRLDWTTWHGTQLGTGHEQIGANTWRCTRCGHTLADDDPENYRIG